MLISFSVQSQKNWDDEWKELSSQIKKYNNATFFAVGENVKIPQYMNLVLL